LFKDVVSDGEVSGVERFNRINMSGKGEDGVYRPAETESKQESFQDGQKPSEAQVLAD
jgi:hypothetical protein